VIPLARSRRTSSSNAGDDVAAGLDAAQAADISRCADFLKHADREIAKVRLPPAPSELRGTGTRVMIAMPVLALKEMHRGQPGDIAAGILAQGGRRFSVANAVDKALGVQREDQPDRSEPEKRGPSEEQSAKIGKRENRWLDIVPNPINGMLQIHAITIYFGDSSLPQPAQMRPEEAVPGAGDVVVGIGGGMMKPMAGDPANRLSGAVKDGKKRSAPRAPTALASKPGGQ